LNKEVEMPRCDFDDVKWCTRVGAIVDNGCSTDVPVWVSSDGALVLPIGGDENMKYVEIGSRIQMSRQIWFVCNKGDLATITGIRDGKEDAPKTWFATMDNGAETYVFEGEFEVVQEDRVGATLCEGGRGRILQSSKQ
jgi:hypothetical protein